VTTTWQPAVILRFTGPRFEAPEAGFDVASELSALKAIILKVAEALFRARHPGRTRLPKGFAEDALLRFREVKRGGVVTVLERGREGGGQLAIPLAGGLGDDDIDRAIELVIAAVRAAGQGEPLPAAFPKDALLLFARWGKELGEDERCELHRPSGAIRSPGASAADSSSSPPAAEYGQIERVRLLRVALGDGVDAVTEVGYVPSIGRGRFELFTDLEGGEGVEVPLAEEHAPLVLEASREYARILVRGLGVFDESGRLLKFIEVDAIEPVDNPPSWGNAQGLLDGLPALSKCRPEEPRWTDRAIGAEDLNAYVYGIGR
jgi:hypothetical protein